MDELDELGAFFATEEDEKRDAEIRRLIMQHADLMTACDDCNREAQIINHGLRGYLPWNLFWRTPRLLRRWRGLIAEARLQFELMLASEIGS